MESCSASKLSRREGEILGLVAEGLTSREIAAHLGLSTSTVETHVRSAMAKLDARTRTQAVAGVTERRPSLARALAPADEEAVELVAQGLTLAEAASALGVSRRTIDRRLARARGALDVRTTAELVARFSASIRS